MLHEISPTQFSTIKPMHSLSSILWLLKEALLSPHPFTSSHLPEMTASLPTFIALSKSNSTNIYRIICHHFFKANKVRHTISVLFSNAFAGLTTAECKQVVPGPLLNGECASYT
jgi:hypothetical protein